MKKSDNRTDNLGKLAQNIGNTLKKMDETSDSVRAHRNEMSEEEKQQIREKNQRRNRAVEGLREEVNDETAYSKTNK